MLSLSLVLGGYFISGYPWVLAAVVLLLFAGGYGVRGPDRIGRLLLIILFFSTGALLMHGADARYYAERDHVYSYGVIDFSGTVSSHSSGADSTKIILSSVRSQDVELSGDLIIYVDSDEYSIGTRLSGRGSTLGIKHKENDGGFDEASYLRCQNIVGKLTDVRITDSQPGPVIYSFLDEISGKIRRFYENSLPGEEGGILSAMCLGKKDALDKDARDLFSGVGLGHIFAISGLHISVVGMSVFGLLRKKRFSFVASGIASSAVLILYGIMVGPTPSSIRAIGMFIIYVVAQTAGCAYDMSSSAALLLFIEYIDHPPVIFHTGFVMSFLAVFFISSLILPAMKRVETLIDLRADSRRCGDVDIPKTILWYEKLERSFLSSFLIQLALIPVVSMIYYRVPGYAVILNMLLLPLVAPFLMLSLISGLLSLGSLSLARILIRPCHFLVYFYEWCCGRFGVLPGGSCISGYPGIVRCAVYYVIFVVLFFVWQNRQDVRIENLQKKAPWRRGRFSIIFGSKMERLVCVGVVCVLLAVIFVRPSEKFSVTMLFVGQGDGICIESGKGHHVFIDGGSSSQTELGKYTLLKYFDYHGIDKVDVWFLTHFDMDHISGCMELLEDGFRVDRIILAKEVEKDENYEKMISICRSRKVSVTYLDAGAVVKLDELTFTVLSPGKTSGYEGANENSLVLWMKYGSGKSKEQFDAIFTGDIGQEQEEDILDSKLYASMVSDSDGKIDLLKAAHHGSNYSNCFDWLETLDPAVCIISAGAHNRYGHPGKETLGRLDELSIPYFCTIDSGQISIRWQDEKVSVDQLFCGER